MPKLGARLQRSLSGVLLLVAIAALISASSAFATSLVFVRTDGSNANCDGTTNAAYPGTGSGLACAKQTIQAGVNAVAANGTVQVAAGTYSEVVTIGSNVTLLGAQAGNAGNSHSGAESIVTGMNVTSANVTIDGFEINPGTSNGGAGLIFNGGTSETVQNTILTGYNSEGAAFYGTGGMVFQNNLLETPLVASAAQDGIYAGTGVSDNAKILNNVFDAASANGGTNIGLSFTSGSNPVISGNASTDGATLVTLFNTTGAKVTGNTFASDPSLAGSVIYIGGHDVDTTVSGNSVSGGYYGVALRDSYGLGPSTGTTITGNTLTNNYGGGIGATGTALGSSETAIAHNNVLTGNPVGISNTTPGAIDATQNYWGTLLASTIASEISGTGITYSPYYVSSTGALDATGTLSNAPNLTALSLSSGALSPAFSPAVTSYTASVGNDVTSITVSAGVVTGASAVASGGSSLAVGANTVQVTVTSVDGTVKTYTVVVTRAAAAAPVTTTTTTTTTTPATTTTTTTTTPIVNQPSPPVAATPTTSGSVSVSVAPVSPATSGNVEPAAPVTVATSWPAGTFTTPVTVQVTPKPIVVAPDTVTVASLPGTGPGRTPPPSPIVGGFTVSNTVFQLTVTDDSTGSAVTSFQAPIVFHVSQLGVGQVPAYSHDGTTWVTIPKLDAPSLPATQPDGYFVYSDGSVDIYTRHATLFGLLQDTQAPSTPKLKIVVGGTGLRLAITGAKDNIKVAGYVVSRNGRGYKHTVRTSIVLPLKTGAYVVRALDTSGNVSAASTAVTVSVPVRSKKA